MEILPGCQAPNSTFSMRLLWVIARNGDRTELDMSIPCLKVQTWGTQSSLYHLSQK